MKAVKFIILSLIILALNMPVFADVMPYYTNNIDKHTIGFVQVPKNFVVYTLPKSESKIADSIFASDYEVKLTKKTLEPSEVFAVQSLNNDLTFCAVIDEEDGGWYKIIYDKKSNKSGWIKPQSQYDFWGLKDFLSYFGKRYGLYYMKNIDYRKRGLYSGAESDAQKIGSFTLIKNIRLNKLSGNWALVTVTDLGCLPKIGYIQWRESDGTIILFPKIAE